MERIAQHNKTQERLRIERANRKLTSTRRQKRHHPPRWPVFTAEEVEQIIADLRAEGIELSAGCCPHGDAT